MANKIYLGDAVYAEDLGDYVKLTVENSSVSCENTIYLDDDVLSKLLTWLRIIERFKENFHHGQ
jgi:hypothetical protein